MSNKDYLEKCKKGRDTWMEETENSISGGNSIAYEEMKAKGREIHALEIIAENMITLNQNLISLTNKLMAKDCL